MCLAGQAGRPQEACSRRQAQAAATLAGLAVGVFQVGRAVRPVQAPCPAMGWEGPWAGQGSSLRRPWGAGTAAPLLDQAAQAALAATVVVSLAAQALSVAAVQAQLGEGGAWTWRGQPGRRARRPVRAMAVQLVGCEHSDLGHAACQCPSGSLTLYFDNYRILQFIGSFARNP